MTANEMADWIEQEMRRASLPCLRLPGRLVLCDGGRKIEITVRDVLRHPDGVVGYTDGRLDWCLGCSSPGDVDEYGLTPVLDGRGLFCEACGNQLGGAPMTWIEEWKDSNNTEWKNILRTNATEDVERLLRRVTMAREARLDVGEELVLGDGWYIRPEARGERCIAVRMSARREGMPDGVLVELFTSLENAKDAMCEFLFDEGAGKGVEWSYVARAYDLDTGRHLPYDTVQTIEWR